MLSLRLLRPSVIKFNCNSCCIHTRNVSVYRKRRDPNPEIKKQSISSESIGINEFAGSHKRLTGVFGNDPSQFHVHEINMKGEIVRLTDLDPPIDNARRKSHYHTHCTLFKSGLATSEITNMLCTEFRKPPSDVSWTGRKDRVAKTTQRISVHNVSPESLSIFSDKSRNLKLGNYECKSNKLCMGQNKGNNFKMLVKDVTFGKSSVDFTSTALAITMNSLKQVGFINYFGHQRFSESGVPTHTIGKALLEKDWATAIDLLLLPRRKENYVISQAKSMWQERKDPIRIMKAHPQLRGASRSEVSYLLSALAQHYDRGKGDLSKVFMDVPIRNLFVYKSAFQSLVWNNVASYRINKFGLEPIVGDFVMENPKISRQSDDGIDPGEVKVLTTEDLQKGRKKYTIHHVLLPALGVDIPNYPNPAIHDYFEKFMKSHGLKVDTFLNRGPLDNFTGFYRSLVVRPRDLDSKIIFYPRDEVGVKWSTFMPSDLDLLTKDECDVLNTSQKPSDNNVMGAIIEFSLPPAAYATMALREVIRVTKH